MPGRSNLNIVLVSGVFFFIRYLSHKRSPGSRSAPEPRSPATHRKHPLFPTFPFHAPEKKALSRWPEVPRSASTDMVWMILCKCHFTDHALKLQSKWQCSYGCQQEYPYRMKQTDPHRHSHTMRFSSSLYFWQLHQITPMPPIT